MNSLEIMAQHFIDKKVIEKAVIGKIIGQRDNQINWLPIKELKGSPEEPMPHEGK